MTIHQMKDFDSRFGGSDQRHCSLPDRAYFNEQLLRIIDSETSQGTQELALLIHYRAREIIGANLSVFWDAENDEIRFESELGIVTVGKSAAKNNVGT